MTSLSTTSLESGVRWVVMATSQLINLNGHSDLKSSVAVML